MTRSHQPGGSEKHEGRDEVRKGAGEGCGYAAAQGVADQGELAGRGAGPGEGRGGQGDEQFAGVEAGIVREIGRGVGVASAE